MTDLDDRKALKAIRQLAMEKLWNLRKTENVGFREARRRAIEEVAESIGVSVPVLENALSVDMSKRSLEKEHVSPRPARIDYVAPTRPDFEKEVEGRPQFQHDFIEDTPMEDLMYVIGQLKGVEVGEAVFVLLDTESEAKRYKKCVSPAVRKLGWKHRRNNPGFYSEVIPVGKHFKLRVKRLR